MMDLDDQTDEEQLSLLEELTFAMKRLELYK